MEDIKNTEKQILEAARFIFLQKGFDGARMQDIADRAEINKAMLHYYFRSKDKLFESVFQDLTSQLFPKLFSSILSKSSMEEKIQNVINSYIDFLIKNPELPLFMLRELNSNPDKITHLLKNILKIDMIKENLQNNLEDSIKGTRIPEIDPMQFILTLLGSCIFPAMAKNLIKLVFEIDDEEFNAFMEKRKEQLPKILINGIKK